MTIKENTSFTNLTWEDLDDWAGERIVGRGKSYQRHVKDLCMTSDGVLVASVRGTKLYSTRVEFNANNELHSQCTCPYAIGCKHAVAMILLYLDSCKNKKNIPLAAPDDERLLELSGENDDTDDFRDSDYEEDEDDEGIEKQRMPSRKNDKVRSHLQTLSKNELVDLLMNGENILPDLSRKLADSDHLKKGDTDKIVKAIRKEIKKISSEPAWSNHWDGENNIPDYSPVKKRLEALLANNHADIVVELGAYLMECGIQQIEQSNDEGETGMEIASCMEVVYQAVVQSNLTETQKILWKIEMNLQDNYGILDGLKGPLNVGKTSLDTWGEVADILSERLDKLPTRQTGKENDFSSKYHRERVMRWLLHALEGANRKNEVNRVLERETAYTDCYVELVSRLVQDKQIEKAREWAYRGFTATLEKSPGIASQLEELLHDIALNEKNYLLATAYCAFEFFDRPSVEKYLQLEGIATKAGVWANVREQILSFLEKGRRPDKPELTIWPLPILQLTVRDKTSRWTHFPDTETLIDIAIMEKRHDDILKWYRLDRKSGGFGRDYTGEKVAQAIQITHSDEALSIWKELATQEILQAKPSAYQTAGHYLKKIKAVYSRTNNADMWAQYISELRERNKRRPRMLDVLKSLEGTRTRIVQ